MIEIRKENNVQYKLRVGRTKAGLGIFAMEPIPKGKKIIEYVGRVITNEEGDNTHNLYIFNLNKNIDIDGSPRWNTARYFNHSCRSNAEAEILKGHVWIKSKKNIMLGEEITYDYGKEYWNEYIKPKGCICPKCEEKKANGKTVVTKKK